MRHALPEVIMEAENHDLLCSSEKGHHPFAHPLPFQEQFSH